MNFFRRILKLFDGREYEHIRLRQMKPIDRKETGEDNAKRFIAHVLKEAIVQRVVVVEYCSKWIWMRNAEWRKHVLDILTMNESPFTSVKFSPPDEYDDDWTFAGYVKDNSRKIEDLSLSDSL